LAPEAANNFGSNPVAPTIFRKKPFSGSVEGLFPFAEMGYGAACESNQIIAFTAILR
jgi:hypothetical protein